jgi:hypothetical protein
MSDNDLTDALAHLKQRHVLVPNAGIVSLAELVALGSQVAEQRAVRGDDAHIQSPPAPFAEPAVTYETDQVEQLQTRLAATTAQLDAAESEARWQRVEDQLAMLSAKCDRLDERSAAIEAALESDDIQSLRELMNIAGDD